MGSWLVFNTDENYWSIGGGGVAFRRRRIRIVFGIFLDVVFLRCLRFGGSGFQNLF